MEELNRQVGRAYRRLGLQRFLGVLGWCWSAALLLALVLIATDGFYPIGPTAWDWAAELCGADNSPSARLAVAAGGWGAAALVLGLLAAVLWTLATRRRPLGAAIEIDRRFGLKERVSSTLAMPPEQRRSEAGRALVADAVGRIERIEISSQFPVRPPRSILLPLLPAALAVLTAWLVIACLDNPAAARGDSAAVRKQVEKSTESLRRKLAERRRQANKQGLKDAEQLFKKLEQGSREMSCGSTDRRKALVELNDYARQLKKRRRQLGGAEQIKKQLEGLKNIDRGPADKFAKAVARGDFQPAADELKKLIDQVRNSKLNDRQKAELARQLEQMKQKLEDLAAAKQAARADLQNRIAQLRAAGQADQAGKLQEQLDKLLQQGPQIKQLDQLADKLGECAQCLRDGQLPDAGDVLQEIQGGLENLQQQLNELEMLDEAMEQLAQAKDQMNCPFCGGAGCEQCQGDVGTGPGQGRGPRGEAETDKSFYDTQVRQKLDRGTADVVDLVDGPNAKGNVEAAIREQVDSVRRGSTDPLTGRRIPRKHRQHAREYFDHFREGE